MYFLANPTKFLKIAKKIQPFLLVLLGMSLAAGLYLGLFASPADYQQGEAVRIMYIHVPSAWMALFIYTNMAVASFVFLVWRHSVADMFARASASIGACFAFLTLVTGSLWGKPMWGAWWVWDARLTSMLILFFLYLGYLALARQAEGDEPAQKTCAILALVGFVNIPIIKFSVEWWNTLHQPASLFRAGGAAIATPMLVPLLLMGLAFTCFYLLLAICKIRTIVAHAKIRRMVFANLK